MLTIIGDGSDQWLHGETVSEVAPSPIALVPQRAINQRTVGEALVYRKWMEIIKGSLSVVVIDDIFIYGIC